MKAPMRLSAILFLLLALCPAPGLSRQTGSAPVAMGGSVPSFVTISPPLGQSDVVVEKDGIEGVVTSSDGDRIIVRLENIDRSSGSSARLRVWIRTNTAYKVEALLMADAPESSVTISAIKARPTGPGVVASALGTFQAMAERTLITTRAQPLASGARISKGAITSPNNAIELVLNVEVEQGSVAAKPVYLVIGIKPS